MMFKTHIAFGSLMAILAIQLIKPPQPWLFFGLMVFCASVPDIDEHKSKIGMKLEFIAYVIKTIFGHRGLFHSIFIPLAIFLILHYWLGWTYIGLAIALGYISHLIADSLTIEGVNFLHPISKFHVSGFIRTGSFLETLFFLTVLGANLFVINYFYLNLF